MLLYDLHFWTSAEIRTQVLCNQTFIHPKADDFIN